MPIWLISIHSTRVGGDPSTDDPEVDIFTFQSTPPVWAETNDRYQFEAGGVISIHSTRVGGDASRLSSSRTASISIHSTRVGGDVMQVSDQLQNALFQSTPPVWAETDRVIVHMRVVAGFQSTPPVWAETAKETIFSSLKHLYYNIFYRKKQENSM